MDFIDPRASPLALSIRPNVPLVNTKYRKLKVKVLLIITKPICSPRWGVESS